MAINTIHVEQPHHLSISQAMKRLEDMPSNDPRVQMLDMTVHMQPGRKADITLLLDVHNIRMKAEINITTSMVVLKSEPLPWYAVPFIWYANKTLKEQLAEALR